MNVENLSIICGTSACNAGCPFCVSKMTGFDGLGLRPQKINWRNFEKACYLAKDARVGSVIITGKGEPTLFPEQISDYLSHMEKHHFPLIDLQTNGIKLAQQEQKYDSHLREWYDRGLAFIAISIVHFLPDKNRPVYTPTAKEYIDLPKLVDNLHERGFSVRFSVTMIDGLIDSPDGIDSTISFSKRLAVEQLTLRRLSQPLAGDNQNVFDWTSLHLLSNEKMSAIRDHIREKGHPLSSLGHRTGVFDVDGQNVCLTDALTHDASSSDIRQIIFYPNGRIRYDWQFKGATIL